MTRYDQDDITPDRLLHVLAAHIGQARGIHCRDLCIKMTGTATPAGMRQIRHCIEDLRRDGQQVCGLPSTGYYLAANEAELNTTCEYLYKRGMTTLTQIAQMKRVSLPDLKGQLRLPT